MEQNDAPPNAFSAAAANTHHGWSADQEEVLAAVQNTCMNSAEKHRVQYFHLQSFLKYFRVPSIILSAVTSVVSVGLQLYVPQETISLVTCLLSLFVGILNSLELYLQIQASMESELMSYKDYYMLANEISKTLVLHPQHRTMDGSAYIEDKFSIFMKLMENAKPLRNRTRDPFRTLDLQLGSGASVIINGAQYHPRRAPSTAFLRTGAGGAGGAAGEREHAYSAVAATTPRRPTQTDRSSSDNQTLSSEEAALPAPHHSLAYAARPDHLLMRHHSGSHPPTPRAAPSSAASLLATAEEGRFRHALGDDPREEEEDVLFNEARDQIRATLEQQHLHQYQHHHQTTSSDDSSSRHMIHPVGSSVDESDGNWFGNAAHRLFGSAVSTPSSRSLGAPPPRAGYFTPSVPSMSPAAAAAAGRRTRPRPPSLVVASARRDDTDSSASSNEPPRQPYRRASPMSLSSSSAAAATAVPVVAGGAFKPQLSPVIEGTQSSFVRPAPIQVAPPPPPPPPMDRGITPEAVRKGLAVTPSRRGDGAKEKQDEEEEEKESIIT